MVHVKDGSYLTLSISRKKWSDSKTSSFLQSLVEPGDLSSTEDFTHLQVNEHDFYRMIKTQKDALKKRFSQQAMTTYNDELTTQQNSTTLSVKAEESQIIEIPFEILKKMFQKAGTLVEQPKALWKMEDYTRQQQWGVCCLHGFECRPHLQLHIASRSAPNLAKWSVTSSAFAGAHTLCALMTDFWTFCYWLLAFLGFEGVQMLRMRRMPEA
jgi:hypothetical protein